MPWCVKKCPYCDFNSHGLKNNETTLSKPLESQYIDALITDIQQEKQRVLDLHPQDNRAIHSIFIGGGTPSLFNPDSYFRLFEAIQTYFNFSSDIEITMEANAGTLEHAPFKAYLQSGINRLSIGVQSFDDSQLKQLGRIHGATEAMTAIEQARLSGFKRLNVDLMHGLPLQTASQALYDIETALKYGATHLSWYQLTIEPNTVFFRTQPQLPDEDCLTAIQVAGEEFLIHQGFTRYEVSAWRKELPSKHNVNYWQFGDYLAIGAGAHGKLTTVKDGVLQTFRYQKTRIPDDYLSQLPPKSLAHQWIDKQSLPFEFFMNGLRLVEGVPLKLFKQRTGLEFSTIEPIIHELCQKKLLQIDRDFIKCTPTGLNYLNSVLQYFL